MALPKIETPVLRGKIASTGKDVRFRPFKVKEEKILMLATEGNDFGEMVDACAQIVNNCVIAEDFDAYEIPMFDLQDMFLQIRKQSQGAQADFRLICGNQDCKKSINYTMELDDFKIEGLEDKPEDFIKVSDSMGIKLKYPTAKLGKLVEKLDDTQLVAKCIDYVVDGEETFSLEDETEENITQFVDDLPMDTFNEVRDFFASMPQLRHRVEFTCTDCGRENVVDINGYEHFFG